MRELNVAEIQNVAGSGITAAAISVPFAGLLTLGLMIPAVINAEIVWFKSLQNGEGLIQSEINGWKHLAWAPYVGASLVKAAYNW